MKILAIIPARGGSKGLVNKNILKLNGHPLIAYSIKSALDSELINKVIVSTDSKKIAKISEKYGAEVPFIRPSEYAQDDSTDYDVFLHALKWLKKNKEYSPDYVIQLRPTSPIRDKKLIDNCINKFAQSRADSLRIVTPAPVNPFKMWSINDNDDLMKPILTIKGIKEPYNMPRQKLPNTYWQIGTLDIIKTSTITELKSMSGNKILSHVVPNSMAVDIDDINSFEIAATVLNENDNLIKFHS